MGGSASNLTEIAKRYFLGAESGPLRFLTSDQKKVMILGCRTLTAIRATKP